MPVLYRTENRTDANLKVYVTDDQADADLVVYETASRWEARDSSVWAYTDVPGQADRVVFFSKDPWNVDLIVYRTDERARTGWRNPIKYGML